MLSVPVQLIACWKDRPWKWPIMCWEGR